MNENEDKSMGDLFPDLGQETPIISGVAHDSSESLATVRGVTDEPGMAARVFTRLAQIGVNIDMIVQAGASTGTADISFTVPLVVAEVNPDDLDEIPAGIVANPNCTTMAIMPVLKPLADAFGLKRLIVSSYQAVSGAGRAGVEQLMNEAKAAVEQGADKLVFGGDAIDFPEPTKVARTIAFNEVPMIGDIVDDGSEETDEEQKLRNESRKILHLPDLKASCTCVRVGVFTSHGMSVNAEFEQDVTPDQAREVLGEAPAVELVDIPTAQLAAGKTPSFVGRIRQDQAVDGNKGLAFFVTNDNLRKGAALNAVELAEVVAQKHFADQL